MNGTKDHVLVDDVTFRRSAVRDGQSRLGILHDSAWSRIKAGIEETNWDEVIIQADDRIRAFIYGLLAFSAIYFAYGVTVGLLTRG